MRVLQITRLSPTGVRGWLCEATLELNVPFLFQVNVSLSFCPSISMSSLIGTRTSGIDAAS